MHGTCHGWHQHTIEVSRRPESDCSYYTAKTEPMSYKTNIRIINKTIIIKHTPKFSKKLNTAIKLVYFRQNYRDLCRSKGHEYFT